MTCHITMERIPSQTAAPLLSSAQRAFLRFHAAHLITEWRWYFAGTQLRASCAAGYATIWKDDLEQLVARGLLVRDHGVSVRLTDAGRATLAAMVL